MEYRGDTEDPLQEGTGPSGSGKNLYEYGGASDTTGSAMDIITNCNVAVDLIDLTGIVSPFSFTGLMGDATTGIAPGHDRVADKRRQHVRLCQYQQSRSEALPGRIWRSELRGAFPLTSANFARL